MKHSSHSHSPSPGEGRLADPRLTPCPPARARRATLHQHEATLHHVRNRVEQYHKKEEELLVEQATMAKHVASLEHKLLEEVEGHGAVVAELRAELSQARSGAQRCGRAVPLIVPLVLQFSLFHACAVEPITELFTGLL